MLAEKTLGFKILIALDRLLNVVTGGSFMICLSTRSYVRSVEVVDGKVRARWDKLRRLIDWGFGEDHCRQSFLWEMRIKAEYIKKHEHLLK